MQHAQAYLPLLDVSYRFTLMLQTLFHFSRDFDIIIFSPGFGSDGFDQPLFWCRRTGRFGNHYIHYKTNMDKDLRRVLASFDSAIYRFCSGKRLEVGLEMLSMCDITETSEKHTLENLFISARVRCKWSVLPATVGLIASLLSHPPGLVCNETEAFGWNDLSLPLSSHLLMCAHLTVQMRRWVEDKEDGKLLLNYKGNINRCWITLLIFIKGNQLKAETMFLMLCQHLDMRSACKVKLSIFYPPSSPSHAAAPTPTPPLSLLCVSEI